MADQQRGGGQGAGADQPGRADETVVMPAVAWPSEEPDAPGGSGSATAAGAVASANGSDRDRPAAGGSEQARSEQPRAAQPPAEHARAEQARSDDARPASTGGESARPESARTGSAAESTSLFRSPSDFERTAIIPAVRGDRSAPPSGEQPRQPQTPEPSNGQGRRGLTADRAAAEETRQIRVTPPAGAAAGAAGAAGAAAAAAGPGLPRRSDARQPGQGGPQSPSQAPGPNQGQGSNQGQAQGPNQAHGAANDAERTQVHRQVGADEQRPGDDDHTERFAHTGTTTNLGAYRDGGDAYGGRRPGDASGRDQNRSGHGAGGHGAGGHGAGGPGAGGLGLLGRDDSGRDGGHDHGHDGGVAGEGPDRRALLRRGGIVAAAVIGLLALLYGADLLLARGEVPRGVLVAGVDIGGLDRVAAERTLREEVAPRLSQPVSVRAGDVESSIDPTAAGLALDWGATIDQAGDQPLNPWTRLRSVFGDREVGVVTQADATVLTPVVEALRGETDREPAEGDVRFDGTTPVPVDPKPGQTLDVPRAVDAIRAHWADGTTVELPVQSQAVRSTPESVRAALDSIARPAVSAPVTVQGEGATATLEPAAIAAALRFEVGPDGTLNPLYDNDKIVEGLRPQLAETEEEGKDASVALQNGAPVVTPSVDGRGVDWPATLAELPNVLRAAGGDRTLTATYSEQPAKFTTEQANALGIKEVVAEFKTGGFAPDSGVNIRVIAAEVNGALLKPGETFSLNTHTGPRGIPQGYVEAGIIDNGKPGRAVGGGCSQFATTLFNAAYFAGLTDVTHKEHSYFISRYPEAREATVFEGVIDLAFKNEFSTGILVETIWTPASITVRMWGTKTVEVESVTSGRSDFTSPQTVTIPFGEKCSASNGAQGFTVSNTRIVRNLAGTEISRTNRRAVYNPQPKIVCATAPEPGQPPPPPAGG